MNKSVCPSTQRKGEQFLRALASNLTLFLSLDLLSGTSFLLLLLMLLLNGPITVCCWVFVVEPLGDILPTITTHSLNDPIGVNVFVAR